MSDLLILLIIPMMLFAWYWLFFRKFNPGSPAYKNTPRDLVFPYIEAHKFYKAATLKAAVNGSGAENYVSVVFSQAAQGLPKNNKSVIVFNKYVSIMTTWAKKVDKNFKYKKKLAQASQKLELEIDKLASECEALGWRFRGNWR